MVHFHLCKWYTAFFSHHTSKDLVQALNDTADSSYVQPKTVSNFYSNKFQQKYVFFISLECNHGDDIIQTFPAHIWSHAFIHLQISPSSRILVHLKVLCQVL